MQELINPVVLERVDYFRDQFQSARPFRHVVIDQLLVPEYCRRLVEEFPAFNPEQARNESGEVGRKAVHENLRELGPTYRRFDRMLQEAKFLGLMGEITGIPRLLYDPHYVGGGTHENLDGQDLNPHVDFNFHPRSNLRRRLNLLLFLNTEWEADWGGLLELHRDPRLAPEEDSIKAVVPIENRCVLFETTEHSWTDSGPFSFLQQRDNSRGGPSPFTSILESGHPKRLPPNAVPSTYSGHYPRTSKAVIRCRSKMLTRSAL